MLFTGGYQSDHTSLGVIIQPNVKLFTNVTLVITVLKDFQKALNPFYCSCFIKHIIMYQLHNMWLVIWNV
jgi:hypothetical protein